MKRKNFRLPVIFCALAVVLSMLLAGCPSDSSPGSGGDSGDSYTLTVTQPANGTISSNPAAGSVKEDTEVTVTVTPVYGYAVSAVKVNNTPLTAPYKFNMPKADATVTAEIVTAPNSRSITALAVKPGGDPLNEVVTFTIANQTNIKDRAFKDDEITVIAPVVHGYDFDEIEITGVTVDGNGKFTMPDNDITITVKYKLNASFKEITIDSDLDPERGSITSDPEAAQAGESVTITVTEGKGYKLDSISVLKASDKSDVSAEVGLNVTGNTGTFTMKDYAVIITATFRDAPTASATFKVNKGALSNGNNMTFTGVDGDSKAAAGETVTVKAEPAGNYEVEGNPSSSVDGVTFVPAATANMWTFTMPAQDITVSITFKVKDLTLTVPASDANGTFTFDKSSGTVAAGTTVTLTATPNAGYKMSPAVTPSSLELIKTPGELKWTFTMPTENVTFTKIFAPLGKLEIYKGGARAGITLDHNETDYNENTPVTGNAAWLAAYDSIVLNADEPGRDGNVRVLKIPHDSNLTFALVSDTPFNIASDNIAALSFWAKGSGGTANIFAVGFGDIVSGNRNDVVTYHGENRDNFNFNVDQATNASISNTWKHYIVPVPASRDLEFTRSFYIRADLWGTSDTVYLDDIEFITSGVSVDEIKIPAAYYTNGDNTATGNLAYPGPNKVTPMLRNKIRGWGDKATTTYVRYRHDDGTVATLFDEWTSRPVRFDRWYLPAFTYTVDGDATIEDAGTFTEGGLLWKEALITTTKRNGTVNLYANLGGKASTPMVIQVADSITLEDFEIYSGGIPNASLQDGVDTGYWHQNMGMTWFADGGDERHDGAKGGLFSPTQTGARGGRNFPASLNLNNCTTITFWMRTAQPADSYTFELANGGTFTVPASGTYVTVPFTITAAVNEWQQVTLNLSVFTGLDKTAVTGWALGVTTHTTGTEYRLYIDTIEAK